MDGRIYDGRAFQREGNHHRVWRSHCDLRGLCCNELHLLDDIKKTMKPFPIGSEAVKKLASSTFVSKGRVDFQSFRMRSLRLRVTHHSNKDMCLRGLTEPCFNFQRLRSKASPIHPSFRFDPCARFFHTFSVTGDYRRICRSSRDAEKAL